MRALLALTLVLTSCDYLAYSFPGTRWGCGGAFECTDGAARDLDTGLTWQRNLSASDAANVTAGAKKCENLRVDGHSDWRLPTIAELATLDDPTWQAHYDADAFPLSGGVVYVSAESTDTTERIYVFMPLIAGSSLVSEADAAGCHGFEAGDQGVFERPKSCAYMVRCVRGSGS